ncbi:MAG: hypothetical protein AAF203_02975 [Pseudomonadota bacterium]
MNKIRDERRLLRGPLFVFSIWMSCGAILLSCHSTFACDPSALKYFAQKHLDLKENPIPYLAYGAGGVAAGGLVEALTDKKGRELIREVRRENIQRRRVIQRIVDTYERRFTASDDLVGVRRNRHGRREGMQDRLRFRMTIRRLISNALVMQIGRQDIIAGKPENLEQRGAQMRRFVGSGFATAANANAIRYDDAFLKKIETDFKKLLQFEVARLTKIGKLIDVQRAAKAPLRGRMRANYRARPGRIGRGMAVDLLIGGLGYTALNAIECPDVWRYPHWFNTSPLSLGNGQGDCQLNQIGASELLKPGEAEKACQNSPEILDRVITSYFRIAEHLSETHIQRGMPMKLTSFDCPKEGQYEAQAQLNYNGIQVDMTLHPDGYDFVFKEPPPHNLTIPGKIKMDPELGFVFENTGGTLVRTGIGSRDDVETLMSEWLISGGVPQNPLRARRHYLGAIFASGNGLYFEKYGQCFQKAGTSIGGEEPGATN